MVSLVLVLELEFWMLDLGGFNSFIGWVVGCSDQRLRYFGSQVKWIVLFSELRYLSM